MDNNPQTILVTGYSQAPKGTPMYEMYKWAGVILEVDVTSGKVVNADATLVSELSRDFLKRLIVGYDLTQGIEPLIELMAARLQTDSRNALVVAIRAAAQRYADFALKLASRPAG